MSESTVDVGRFLGIGSALVIMIGLFNIAKLAASSYDKRTEALKCERPIENDTRGTLWD